MLDELNPQQREVAQLRQNCVAIACPGAGKTKTIATKAALLLQENTAMVGAVTFSKDAAIELRERILAVAGKAVKKRLIAGTFHSLAYKQLQRPGSRPLDIASDGDRLGLLIRVMQDLGFDGKAEDVIPTIEKIKTNFGQCDSQSAHGQLYLAYQEALARNGKIDFQDMLRLAVEGMQNGTILPYPFTYLLVDEFQDTDPLQYRWIELHAKAGSIVTVVGDDDQSIYAFREALGYRGMESFIKEFDAKPVVLGSNYRCRSEILAAADRVIRNNVDRIAKVLRAEKGPGGSVLTSRHADEYIEATAAVEALAPLLAKGESCAILARTNRILDPLEAVCRSHGVKYYRASGASVLSRPEGALMCNLLEIVERIKETGLDAVLAHLGLRAEQLRSLHASMGAELTQKPRAELVELGLPEDVATNYREFMKRLAEWRGLCDRKFYSLVLEGVNEWMLKYAKKESAIRTIQATYDVLTRLKGSLAERLLFLRQQNNEPTPGALILTTMHSSKGLEWEHVWIARSEESVVPDAKSTETEERRLFYVAMTRARESLMISGTSKNFASRFVTEAQVDAVAQAA
ncbi:ATP-dependent helicase [Paraburkholderia domus]|uniref:ATP-dependent helicase n=1 Tax=Paraburkholderia domus TaxID=2793075 RepID=UPI001911E995|nr:ATP-dependent helicase [Paraburkholderia domus]MBK5066035.1 ATP-dependent helicase [Burkholderia sp. R-70199]CAE6966436.1 ATP-dependent DNA helicase Rep [Paraburkholderia domus]